MQLDIRLFWQCPEITEAHSQTKKELVEFIGRCMALDTHSMQWKSPRRDARRGLFYWLFSNLDGFNKFCFRIRVRIWFCRERLSIWIGNIVVVQKERNVQV